MISPSSIIVSSPSKKWMFLPFFRILTYFLSPPVSVNNISPRPSYRVVITSSTMRMVAPPTMSRTTVASATSRKVANVFTVMDMVCIVVIVAGGGGGRAFGRAVSSPCRPATCVTSRFFSECPVPSVFRWSVRRLHPIRVQRSIPSGVRPVSRPCPSGHLPGAVR